LSRVVWLAPLALFGHALALTQSRGGFLGAAVGLAVLLLSRFRGIKALVLAAVTLTSMFVLFSGGRQTSLSTNEASSQSRIHMWDAGFEMFKRSPVIGVGIDGFVRNTGHVAHNAFIQTYAELGFLGGTFLFGQYFFCLNNLLKLGSRRVVLPDPEMRRLRPFILASLAGFTTSEMSLTNPFGLVTYVMLGLATVFIRLADPSPPLADLRLNRRLIYQTVFYSGLFLAAVYAFVRYSVRYG
jgi:O-antigen ligase